MDAGIEKECSALGGLFQVVMNDMKASYPTWEDFVTKGAKLQSHLRTTITMTGAFLDAFQKVADMATGTRGATKDIGSALTRMCMRHRSIESKLKLFTTALSESLITPLELKMEEWKKGAGQLDKDHAKEYKKARADIKKKSSDTIKLQKKVKKGKDQARGQLDSALQDVNVRYAVLEETEKRAVCRALVEERARYCSFVSMLKPVLDHEINMLGEVTHLQTILEDLIHLTAEPNKLPAASEQVILDLKGSEFNYTYQTPPASPSSTLSRKSSISSFRSPADLLTRSDSFSALSLSLSPPPPSLSLPPLLKQRVLDPQIAACFFFFVSKVLKLFSSMWDVLVRAVKGVSGYTNTTNATISPLSPSLADYESISLHGDVDSVSLHHLSHGTNFDKSSTIPRNSDLSLQFRKLAQSKRPTSTVSLLAEPDAAGRPGHQLPSHTATIRRKPSSKPAYRRGTISGGVPIPISTPQIPRGSEENVFIAPSAGGPGGLGYSKLCTSTQSLSALGPSSSPYYQLIPGHMPIPVAVPTVPPQPAEESSIKYQQINSRSQQLQQQRALQQHQQQQLQMNPPVQQYGLNPHPHQSQSQSQYQLPLSQQQQQKLFQQQQQAQLQVLVSAGDSSTSGGLGAPPRPRAPSSSTGGLEQTSQTGGEGGGGGGGGGGLLSQIRSIKLKRTTTDDRSAPLLPCPPAPK
uniref:MTSS I-BAR domain containing 1 n=1 Tax=Takifugu rubripes TaxID=31033 RepID=A0A674PLS6_TAKRU